MSAMSTRSVLLETASVMLDMKIVMATNSVKIFPLIPYIVESATDTATRMRSVVLVLVSTNVLLVTSIVMMMETAKHMLKMIP